MHVVYIHQHFSTRKGATGTRSYEMAQCLIDAGHKVSMVTGVSEATKEVFKTTSRVEKIDIDGIDVYCIAEPYSNKMGFWRRVLAFQRFANRSADVATATGADLVFATSTPLTVGIPGMKAARRLKAPFVFEVRDLWPEMPIAMGIIKNPLIKWYTRRMERNIYAAASRMIALSPGMVEGVVKVGYPAEKITMIPNSCDLDLFRPDPTPLDDPRFGPPGDFRLVFTGAHGRANGLDAVLDAAAELVRRGEKGIRFCFIGQGSERDRLVQRSRDEGTDRMISWQTFVPKEELARLLPRMDAGMMILANHPGFYYGTSPNKFFDYISCGIPVLNNYPGWVAGMLEKYRCGVVVPPGDAKAFADACVWMRDHRDECEAMGPRGRALAEAEFDRKRLGREFVKWLEAAYTESRR